MKTPMTYTLKDALMSGPGLDAYAYNAALYCPDCAAGICRKLWASRLQPAWIDEVMVVQRATLPDGTQVEVDVEKQIHHPAGYKPWTQLEFQDSETVPQPVFFGESDCAEHCDRCGAYLYGEDEDPTGEDLFEEGEQDR